MSPKAQPNSVIPDDIARQLAEMLQAFHRLGAGATAGAGEYRGGKQQSIEEEEASIEVVSAARSRRPSPKSSSAGGSDTSTVLPVRHRARLSVSSQDTGMRVRRRRAMMPTR